MRDMFLCEESIRGPTSIIPHSPWCDEQDNKLFRLWFSCILVKDHPPPLPIQHIRCSLLLYSLILPLPGALQLLIFPLESPHLLVISLLLDFFLSSSSYLFTLPLPSPPPLWSWVLHSHSLPIFPDYFLSSSSPVCFNLFLSTCILHSTPVCSPCCGGCSFS